MACDTKADPATTKNAAAPTSSTGTRMSCPCPEKGERLPLLKRV